MSVHSTDAGRNGLRFRKVFLSQCRWLVLYYPEVSTFAAPVLSIPSYIIIFKLFYINFRESQRHTKPIHNSMLIKIQPDATVCRYLFTAKPLYMFRMSQHPSSGVLKTVTAASVTGHNIGTATSLQRGLIGHVPQPPVQVIILVQLLPSNVAWSATFCNLRYGS